MQLIVSFIAGTNGTIRSCTVFTSSSPPKKEIWQRKKQEMQSTRPKKEQVGVQRKLKWRVCRLRLRMWGSHRKLVQGKLMTTTFKILPPLVNNHHSIDTHVQEHKNSYACAQ